MLPIMTHAIYSTEIFLTEIEPMICTIAMVVKETIHIMQSSYFLFVGVLKGKKVLSKPSTPILPAAKRAESVFSQIIGFVKSLLSYDGMHSALFLGTGTCELMLGLQVFDYISLGSMTPVVANLSSGCFILANLVMLIQSVEQYDKASLGMEKDKIKNERIKRSSILAIISALNYIAGMATIALGGPPALIVVLLSLGLTFGGLKILYDFFRPVCPVK